MKKKIIVVVFVICIMCSLLTVYSSAFGLPVQGDLQDRYILLGGDNTTTYWDVTKDGAAFMFNPESYKNYTIYSISSGLSGTLNELIEFFNEYDEEQKNNVGLFNYYFMSEYTTYECEYYSKYNDYKLSDKISLVSCCDSDIKQLFLRKTVLTGGGTNPYNGQLIPLCTIQADEDVALVIDVTGTLKLVVFTFNSSTSKHDIVEVLDLTLDQANLLIPNTISKSFYEWFYQQSYKEGFDAGLPSGSEYQKGYDKGYEEGYNEAWEKAYDQGITEGYDIGYEEGYQKGAEEGGNGDLYNNAYDKGYEDGVLMGVEAGKELCRSDHPNLVDSEQLKNYYNIGYLAGQDTNGIVNNGISGFFSGVTSFFEPFMTIGIGNLTVYSMIALAVIVALVVIIIKVVNH